MPDLVGVGEGPGDLSRRLGTESTARLEAPRAGLPREELAARAADQWGFWLEELEAAENLYERGCGWR